jgi:hypothetical protein
MDHVDKDLLMRRIAAYLSVVIVLGFFGIMVMLAMVKVPPDNKDTLIQMVGALILAFGGLMGYLYGSSKNSEATSRALTTIATAPVAPAGMVKVDDSVPVRVEEVPAK